jgi:hypothetical protein
MIRRMALSLKPMRGHLPAMADVDLALVLAFDGSASVTYDEFGLMTGGCGAALRQPNIVAGMTGGPSGASLCAVLLWSSAGMQATLVDWTLIDSPAAAANFATDVQDLPRLVPAGNTALGDALQACERLLGRLPRPGRSAIAWSPAGPRSTACACCSRSPTCWTTTPPR